MYCEHKMLFSVILTVYTNDDVCVSFWMYGKANTRCTYMVKIKLSHYTPWRRLGVGERRYSSYSFLTSALDGGKWSVSRPDTYMVQSNNVSAICCYYCEGGGTVWSCGRCRVLYLSPRWYMSEYGTPVEWYWQGKTEGLGKKTRPSATLSTTNPTWIALGAKQGLRGGVRSDSSTHIFLYSHNSGTEMRLSKICSEGKKKTRALRSNVSLASFVAQYTRYSVFPEQPEIIISSVNYECSSPCSQKHHHWILYLTSSIQSTSSQHIYVIIILVLLYWSFNQRPLWGFLTKI
jgi:hypothetical protein